MKVAVRVFAWVTASLIPSLSLAATVVVPTDYSTISAAITAVSSNGSSYNTIIVEPGTYSVNLALTSNLTLRGRETSRTFLTPVTSSTTPVITASAVDNVRVSNFTFLGANSGLSLANSSNVRVSNNVFHTDAGVTALSVTASTSVTVENNTFVNTGTALTRDSDQVVVHNNIFSGNDVAISPSTLTANITYNGFFSNTNNGTTGTNAVTGSDALFVSVVNNDLHLRQGSAAINAGSGSADAIDATTADLGAFGGTDAEGRPFPVQNFAISATTSNSVTLSWDPNLSYLITHTTAPGSYRLYYGPASGSYTGSDAAEGASPINVATATHYSLTGLSGAPVLAAPTGLTLSPGDGALRLRWNPVAGAAGYRLHYGVGSTAENQIDVGNVTTYELTGLTNGTTYRAAISALAQRTLFLTVTAVDSTPSANESSVIKTLSTPVGGVSESPLSNEVSDFPEKLVAYPTLPDEGCFIATAAFGHYDASQVQALRDLRDRYLLNTGPGRDFVAWYYRHSPAAAHWLNRHEGLKPLVRLLLLPAVVVSEVLTGRASPWPWLGATLLLSAVIFARTLRRRRGLA